MPNGNDHRIPFERMREPSPLQKLQGVVTELIDFTLAMAAISMERGTFSHEELFRMESVIKDARRKMGSIFTIEEGMKAVRAAFRLENPDGK